MKSILFAALILSSSHLLTAQNEPEPELADVVSTLMDVASDAELRDASAVDNVEERQSVEGAAVLEALFPSLSQGSWLDAFFQPEPAVQYAFVSKVYSVCQYCAHCVHQAGQTLLSLPDLLAARMAAVPEMMPVQVDVYESASGDGEWTEQGVKEERPERFTQDGNSGAQIAPEGVENEESAGGLAEGAAAGFITTLLLVVFLLFSITSLCCCTRGRRANETEEIMVSVPLLAQEEEPEDDEEAGSILKPLDHEKMVGVYVHGTA